VTPGTWTIDDEACCSQHGARFHEVHAGRPVRWPPPEHVGGPEVDLLALLPERIPATGVLDVRGAAVDGSTGWISVAGRVLRDHTWYGAALEVERDRPDAQPRPVHLPGTTVTLMSDFAEVNYGHLLFDVVPRRSLLAGAAVDLDQVDHVLCCAPPTRRDYVMQLALPVERIVWAEPGVRYRTERLLAPSFPGVRRALQPWAAAAVRAWLEVPASGSGRRLYLVREEGRRVVNQDELDPVLDELDFERFEPVSSGEDQRAAFAAADVVVGVAGSALTSILFCAPGASVVELLPTDHVYPYHYTAALAAGLDYRYLVVDSTVRRGSGAVGPSVADVVVDVAAFDRALREVVRQKGAGPLS
jgi:hypothetical protein